MKRFLITFLTVAFICTPIFANAAKVTFVKGKVEVERDGAWVALKVGDTVEEKETVSTGFQSEARLNLNGSILAVAALSRVTLEEMSVGTEKDTVSLYINTGAIRSKVTHAEGKKIDYSSRTSVAVASVRGTDYKQKKNGKIQVVSGAVAVSSRRYLDAVEAKQAKKAAKAGEEGESEDETGEGSASGTTPANKISKKSYFGSVVVGANQETKFTETGNPERPINTSKTNAEKAKNRCQTQAEKETENMGGTSKKNAIIEETPTGSLVIEFNFPN